MSLLRTNEHLFHTRQLQRMRKLKRGGVRRNEREGNGQRQERMDEERKVLSKRSPVSELDL